MDSIDLEKMTEETFCLCERIEHVDPFCYPASTGLVFRVESLGGVFAIKGFACSNISDVFEEIVGSPELKKNGIKFFETPSLDEAELISKNLFNRHFSLYEDFVTRGDRWQLNLNQGSMLVHYYDRGPDSIPLGPLGDKNLLPTLLENVEGIRIEKSKLSCEIIFDNSEIEIALRNLLLNGEMSLKLEKLASLALLRQFWLLVERELFCKNSMLH